MHFPRKHFEGPRRDFTSPQGLLARVKEGVQMPREVFEMPRGGLTCPVGSSTCLECRRTYIPCRDFEVPPGGLFHRDANTHATRPKENASRQPELQNASLAGLVSRRKERAPQVCASDRKVFLAPSTWEHEPPDSEISLER